MTSLPFVYCSGMLARHRIFSCQHEQMIPEFFSKIQFPAGFLLLFYYLNCVKPVLFGENTISIGLLSGGTHWSPIHQIIEISKIKLIAELVVLVDLGPIVHVRENALLLVVELLPGLFNFVFWKLFFRPMLQQRIVLMVFYHPVLFIWH